MNQQQIQGYFEALVASVTIGVIVPLFMFVVMIGIFWRLVVMAQRKPDFHIEQIFLGDDNRASVARFIMVMAFAFSCWYLAVGRVNTPSDWDFPAFLAAWANSLTFVKLAERWNGVLPFAKTPQEQQ